MNDDQIVDRKHYLNAVLMLYLELPETPLRAGPHDRERAGELLRRQVPFSVVESALLLGSLRRLGRPEDSPPLSPIRSFAYFIPVIEELLVTPLPDGYLQYLRDKVRRLCAKRVTQPGLRSKNYSSS